MKYGVMAGVLLLTGCATSYEAATSHRMLSGGGYLIQASGNIFTSPTTITDYLYMRADELCAAGFSVMDSDRATEVTTDLQGYSSSKASGSLAIVCARPRHATAADAEDDDDEDDDDDDSDAAKPPAATERRVVTGTRPIYCTHADLDPDVGMCSLIEATCQAARDAKAVGGETYTPCQAEPAAACFNAVRVLSGEKRTECTPSIAGCDRLLATFAANPDYRLNAHTCGIYRVQP